MTNKSISRREFLKLSLSLGLLGISHTKPLSSAFGVQSLSNSPNVLIIVFDTLSALHLPFHGYPRQTTPNLARLADRANVYHAHYSSGNFTTPGTASILTGVYPWTHRALQLHGTMLEEYSRRTFFNLAPQDYFRTGYSHNLLVTSLLYQAKPDLDEFLFSRALADADLEYSDIVFPSDYNASIWSESVILRDIGYLPSSLFLSQAYRFIRDWRERKVNLEHGDQFPGGVPNNNEVLFTLEKGIDWSIDHLRKWPQPFLSYLHFFPPHYPYTPREEFVGLFADGYKPTPKPRHRFSEKGTTKKFLSEKRQAYDEYLAYADSEFGRLFDYMEQSGMLENTYVIFTSDHGEMFERNIWGHSTRVLYEPVIRVPLLIMAPGQKKRQDIRTVTSNIDLMPTLMNALGQPIPDWSEGLVLPSNALESENRQRSLYVMELKENTQRGPIKTGTFALFRDGYKYIHYMGYPERLDDKDELYLLSEDPEELDNRAETEKTLAMEMRQELLDKIKLVNSQASST